MDRRIFLLLLLLLVVLAGAVLLVAVARREEGGPGLLRGDDGDPPRAPVLVGSGGERESDAPSGIGGVADAGSELRPWFLEASVVNDDDETPVAIAGATVSVYLQFGWDYEHLATGTSGAEGNVRFDLRSLAERARTQMGLGRLVAFTNAPGHFLRRGMPDRIGRPIGDDLEPTVWSLKVGLEPSPVVRGRVLRETGEPLPKATIYLIPTEGERTLGDIVFTDPEGRYAVPAPNEGSYRVHCQRRDVERGRSEPIVVDGVSDYEAPDIKLKTLPATPGVVRFRDGSPVADFTVEITHPYFDPHTYVWSPRLGPVRVRTDGLGRFTAVLPHIHVFGGRREVAFSLEIPGVKSEETGFDPEAGNLEITVPPHRLRVRLRDGVGGPLRGQKVAFHRGGSRWHRVRGTTDQRGEVSLFVPLGAEGRLRVVRIGNALLSIPVEIPSTGNESTLLVDVPDQTAFGTLGFRMRTPSGSTVFPVKVDVQSTDECDVVDDEFKSDGDRIVLPPGSYRVTLWSSAQQPWEDVPDTRSVVRPDGPIVIRDGEDTTVDVMWGPTAGLALRVTAPEAAGETLPESRALIEPLDGDRSPLSLDRRWGNTCRALYTTEWMFSYWLYEPGVYRVTLEAQGYRTLTHEVRLVAGVMTRIELAMERER